MIVSSNSFKSRTGRAFITLYRGRGDLYCMTVKWVQLRSCSFENKTGNAKIHLTGDFWMELYLIFIGTSAPLRLRREFVDLMESVDVRRFVTHFHMKHVTTSG